MVPGSNSSGSSGGGGDGNGDRDNNLYDPSSADNNHGKEEGEEEDMQHGDNLGGEYHVVTVADGESDEDEPPDDNNEPVPEISNEPVDIRNESTISSKTTSDTSEFPVDVFGDYEKQKSWLHLAVGKLKHTVRKINVILLKLSLN